MGLLLRACFQLLVIVATLVAAGCGVATVPESVVFGSGGDVGGEINDGHFSQNAFLSVPSLRREVVDMFYHAYGNYMEHAFPHDELKPLSCHGDSSFYGGLSLSMLDALDTLAVLGDAENFTLAADHVGLRKDFDVNVSVSVFETNIRILGGLLSAHMIAADSSLEMYGRVSGSTAIKPYDGFLLRLAVDLADRLVPAFNTPTGIPYGSINLKYGVKSGESTIVCTAAAGTFTLEFGVLTRLTGNGTYERVARKAARAIFALRSSIGLVGAHVDIVTGKWTQVDSGIGSFIDSYFEYLWKSYLLFGHPDDVLMWTESYKALQQHLKRGPWYLEVNMNTAQVSWAAFSSLQGFWPGLQATWGDTDSAEETMVAFFSLWTAFGFAPERFDLMSSGIYAGFGGYPLRPEFAESLFFLYSMTKDQQWLSMGREMVSSLQALSRVDCGYSSLENITSHKRRDFMDSFFLSETLKYLFLLFSVDDFSPKEKPPVWTRILDGEDTIFTTEAHPISRSRLQAMQVPGDYFGSPSIASDDSTDESVVEAASAVQADFLKGFEPMMATVENIEADEIKRTTQIASDPEYRRIVEKAQEMQEGCPRTSDMQALRNAYIEPTTVSRDIVSQRRFHPLSPSGAGTGEHPHRNWLRACRSQACLLFEPRQFHCIRSVA